MGGDARFFAVLFLVGFLFFMPIFMMIIFIIEEEMVGLIPAVLPEEALQIKNGILAHANKTVKDL